MDNDGEAMEVVKQSSIMTDVKSTEYYLFKHEDFDSPFSNYSPQRRKSNECNQYGLFGYTFPFLSMLTSPVWYLVWYSLVILCQTIVVHGLVNSSIVSLEKRYKLSSKESSIIAAMFDIGCCLVVLPVSFYGNKDHKPQWVGIGSIIMSFGCFIFVSPHFLASSYEYTDSSSIKIILCSNISNAADNCDSKMLYSKLQNFKYLFYIGQFCMGIGSSPLYTLGLAYIEEINPRQTSSLHIGITSAISAIGPAFGYALSGLFLQIFVDVSKNPLTLNMNDKDIWVGAWWISFIIMGLILLILSLPLLMFPNIILINNTYSRNSTKRSIISSSDIDVISKIFKNIFQNLKYICVSISITLSMLSLRGLSTYGPKYLENVFSLTASSATIIVGVVSVPTLATGSLLGAILLSKYNWKLRDSFLFMSITSFICVPLSLVFLLRCDEQKMAGINEFYHGTDSINDNNLTSPCNEACNCPNYPMQYSPSCGSDHITYFSPCFAGCSVKEKMGNVTIFQNCSCLDTAIDIVPLTSGACKEKLCKFFYVFLFFTGLLLLVTYLKGTPSVTATMRSVHHHELAFALGFQNIAFRLFGSIPGPIVFGAFIDFTCITWDKKCNEFGNCLKYDIRLLTILFWAIMSTINFLITICFVIPQYIRTRF